MGRESWAAVDRYVTDLLAPSDAALDAALESCERAGLPAAEVSPTQGMLLHILARMQRPQAILEVGTLGGYSTIWLARALEPGGRLVTLELSAAHAAVAAENVRRAGLTSVVDVRVGPALESLAALAGEDDAVFDLIFLDADKQQSAAYLDAVLALTRPGTVIVADNVVRDGALADAGSDDARVQGVRLLHERLAQLPDVSATTIQTVGVKGYDGFTLALVG